MNGGGDSDPLALPILLGEQCYHTGSVALAQNCFTDEWTGELAQE